jgi:acetyl esterase/lipase
MKHKIKAAIVAGALATSSMVLAQPGPPPGFYIRDLPAPAQPGALRLYQGTAPGTNADALPEQWQDIMGEVIVRNVAVPTLTPFLPAKDKATGTAVIIAPGGAYLMASMQNEGWPVAQWFAEHGVAAFVLKYRMDATPRDTAGFMKALGERFGAAGSAADHHAPNLTQPLAVADGQAAMRMVRAHAHEWNIDPDKVGFIGFSAGAMTAMQVTLADEPASRPNFVGYIYGPMTPVNVPASAPPLFAALASDDGLFGSEGFGVISAWHTAGKSVELHFYEKGGHGFGMGKAGTTTPEWKESMLDWLGTHGFAVRKR